MTLHHELGSDRHQMEVVDDSGRVGLDDIGLVKETRTVEKYSITDGDPLSARGEVVTTVAVERPGWRVESTTSTSLRVTERSFILDASLSARLDGREQFSREWHSEVPRDLV